MNTFEKFLAILDAKMAEPTPYGWFHLMFWAITILAIVLLVVFARKANDKWFRAILITTASIMILLEIYKQLNFSFDPSSGVWDYQWYAFPFQFCSTPMYVMLIAGIVKKGKFQDALLSYLGTFCLIAGTLVMFIPTTVFIETIGINIQTMIHHSSMVIIGVYVLSTKRLKLSKNSYLSALAVFASLVTIALALNLITHGAGLNETFNMFFISPYFPCELPVFEIIQQHVPYVVFLALYFVAFSIAGLLVQLLAKGIFILIEKIKTAKKPLN